MTLEVFTLIVLGMAFTPSPALRCNSISKIQGSRYTNCVTTGRTTITGQHHNILTLNAQAQTVDEPNWSLLDRITSPEASLTAGVAGILVILFNRLFLSDDSQPESFALAASDIQSRSDLLAVMACSGLLLNVLSDQEIITRERDQVVLNGYSFQEPQVALPPTVQLTDDSFLRERLQWLLLSLLPSSLTAKPIPAPKRGILAWKEPPITSVHVFDNKQQLLATQGVVHASCANQLSSQQQPWNQTWSQQRMPILQQALQENREIYLPDLQVRLSYSFLFVSRAISLYLLKQILPGKIEFTYLPDNAQSVLILPLPPCLYSSDASARQSADNAQDASSSVQCGGVVVIATNQAKALTLAHLRRIRAIVDVFSSMCDTTLPIHSVDVVITIR